MEESDIQPVLHEIGLSDRERKVYLALLKGGESTSGPIAERSGVAANKIYEVIERLSQKGLVGEVEKRGIKHFQAVHPKAILDYLRERQDSLQSLFAAATKVLPALTAQYEEHAEETVVQLLQGFKSFKNAFYAVAETLEPGEEYRVLGANYGMEQQAWIRPFFQQYHRFRAKKGVKVRLLFQHDSKPEGIDFRNAQFRILQPGLKNPLQVVTYRDTTLLHILHPGPLLIRIKNQEITDSFDQYFESLWSQSRER